MSKSQPQSISKLVLNVFYYRTVVNQSGEVQQHPNRQQFTPNSKMEAIRFVSNIRKDGFTTEFAEIGATVFVSPQQIFDIELIDMDIYDIYQAKLAAERVKAEAEQAARAPVGRLDAAGGGCGGGDGG